LSLRGCGWLACPVHGVRVEGVDFTLPSSRFTSDFEQLVAWLAVKMDQDALRRLVDIDWDTAGRICDRVVADVFDPARLDDLYDIGVDEMSWKHHNYLTLVVNTPPTRSCGAPKDVTPRRWTGCSMSSERPVAPDPGRFDGHGPRVPQVGDRGGPRPQATVCFDPFHGTCQVGVAGQVGRVSLRISG
jgi:transposase